jgi:predicted outer membrane repeat protein
VNNGGVFILNNGIIAGNVAGFGGGVYVAGTFTMNGGEIADNFAAEHGGGVASGGTFTLNGGEIAGNSISSNTSSSPHSRGGGGVFAGGAFTMTGGTIAGNSAFGNDVYGGGVYIADWNNLSFKKTGGTIYGSNGSVINNKETRNLVKELPDNLVNSKGHAVYHDAARFRDTTLEGGNELYYNDPVKGTSGWN